MAHRGIACAKSTKFPDVSMTVTSDEHKLPNPHNQLDVNEQNLEDI
jgi:hypothetical protein